MLSVIPKVTNQELDLLSSFNSLPLIFLGYSLVSSQGEHLGGGVLDYVLQQGPFIFIWLYLDSIQCNVSSFLSRGCFHKVIFIRIIHPPTVHICTRIYLTH